MIGSYTGLKFDLVNKLADSVKLGIDEFKKAAKAKETEARKDIQANAKAEDSIFINSK